MNGTATVYTDSFKLKQGVYFGLWAKASATGTPTVKIQLEQSYTAPTLGETSTPAADANFVVPDSFPDIFSNLNDTVAHVKSVSPVPMTYGRFKITGLATNPADTVIDMRLFLQDTWN